MYQPSYLLTELMPSPEQVKEALRSADADKNRDNRNLSAILMRMRAFFPRIRNFIRIRRVGVTSFGWEITANDTAGAADAEKAKLRCKKAITRILKYHTDTPIFGNIALELQWDDLPTGFTPRVVRHYSPVEIMWDAIPENLAVMPGGDIMAKTPIPPEALDKWILDTDENDEPGGIMRSVIFKSILDKDQENEWANFNTFIKGLIYANVPSDADDAELEIVQKALSGLVKRKYAIVDELTKFNFQETASVLGSATFKDILAKLEIDIAIAFLGQANTTELGANGSFSALQVLRMITADIVYEDISRCEAMINDQLLAADFRLNKSLASPPPYTFRFIIPEETDIEKRAAVVETMGRAGVPLMADEVYRMTGFTKPTGAPDVLFEQPAGGAGGNTQF